MASPKQPLAKVASIEFALDWQRAAAAPLTPSAPLKASRYLNSAQKRALDVVLCLIFLVNLLPLLGVVAIAVKATSSGPILFRQFRYGLHRETFRIRKFRTMYAALSDPENATVVRQAERHDARTTPLGRFLRMSSIDELPQLLDVLQGRMSLVGPRPHAVAHDDFYLQVIGRYGERFDCRPGITGLAQVNGARGPTPTVEDMERRLAWDLRYISEASLMLDLKIIFATARQALVCDAY
ncbi:sugar transferase [Methylobacterium oxalidis]|uniref:sugar transferase n=1 Tax=Methylobacterium oxalidis TaxID=944322 RepID=UPI00331546F4